MGNLNAESVNKLSSIGEVRKDITNKLKILEESFKQNVTAIQEYQNRIKDLDTNCKEIKGAMRVLADLMKTIDGGELVDTRHQNTEESGADEV